MSSVTPWDDARARLSAAALGVPIEWPNEPAPQLAPDAAGHLPLWIQVDMSGDVLGPIEMGQNGAWQEEGYLVVRIHAPRNSGSRDARVLGKRIADLFRGLAPGPVMWGRASLGEGETPEASGRWWLMSLHIDYRYQDIPSR